MLRKSIFGGTNMVVGIVAEYNPFHNGHKLQIEYAKKVLHASHVVVAMSGPFTQRGEIACFDKYVRAHAALLSGADIVLEIPTIFATASAKEYASAAVQLLASTGIVDTLLFSAEYDDADLFKSSAKLLVTLENNGKLDKEINTYMQSGCTFAAARSKALEKHLPTALISNPNSILGIEYCRYIEKNNINMDVAVLKRQNNDYRDDNLTGEISSATSIRNNMSSTGEIKAVPENCLDIYKEATYMDADDVSQLLHFKLITEQDFERYLDCTGDLADRIRNNVNNFVSFTQFCQLLKTKNITYTRISRVLCHILLNITSADFEEAKANGYISYLRMLGFSKYGVTLLGDIKKKASLQLITSPTEDIHPCDIFASDIYRIICTNKKKEVIPNEYTRKFNLTNI